MTLPVDPYRVLGLTRGAPEAEVKRAYRRLAKQFHPDSAGERALPRFLAIQAAYEAIVGPGRAGTGRFRRPAPGQPGAARWEADADRARATRDAYGRWARSRAGAGGPADASGDPTGPAAGATGSTGGATGATGGPRPRRAGRPTGGPGQRPTGTTGGAGSADPGRRARGPRKATLGSTSYDEAGRGPFEATWEGATWYGASSGTYWTINPKEYADPRKHGPDYLARARRTIRGRSGQGARPAGEPATSGTPGATGPAATSGTAADTPGPEAAAARAEAGFARSTSGGVGTARAWDAGPTSVAGIGGPPTTDAIDDDRVGDGTDGARSGRGRLERSLLALVGWPPIGLALVGAYGELTGCGRFAATCPTPDTGPFGIGTWLVQLLVIVGLALMPRAAGIAAAGTLALLAAAVPTAVLLSAAGGARDPANASAVLAGVLALAWLVGAALALSGRLDPRRRLRARVR